MTTKHTFREHILRVVAVIGLIAVLLLGAWGIIQLAFFIPTFLGNIGGSLTAKNEAPKTTATTTVKTAVVTETPKPVVKTPAAKPAATTYVASAKPRAALYGYPDLRPPAHRPPPPPPPGAPPPPPRPPPPPAPLLWGPRPPPGRPGPAGGGPDIR